jgi:hypothetical protein
MAIIQVELGQERESGAWYAGEALRGVLRVHTDGPTRVQSLGARLIAERPAPLGNYYTGAAQVFVRGDVDLPAGTTDIPFVLDLPPTLFPTYQGAGFCTSYRLVPLVDGGEHPGQTITILPAIHPHIPATSAQQLGWLGKEGSASMFNILGGMSAAFGLIGVVFGFILLLVAPPLGAGVLAVTAPLMLIGLFVLSFGRKIKRSGISGQAQLVVWPQVVGPGEQLHYQLTITAAQAARLTRARLSLFGAETFTVLRKGHGHGSSRRRHSVDRNIHSGEDIVALDVALTAGEAHVVRGSVTVPNAAPISAKEELPLPFMSFAREIPHSIELSWRVCCALELIDSDVIQLDVPVIIAHLAPAPQHTPQEHSQQAAASSGHRSQR